MSTEKQRIVVHTGYPDPTQVVYRKVVEKDTTREGKYGIAKIWGETRKVYYSFLEGERFWETVD